MLNGLSKRGLKLKILEHLPGPTEPGVTSAEMERRTGIPSRKVAAIITNDMKHDTAEVTRTRKSRRASPQNVYRRRY